MTICAIGMHKHNTYIYSYDTKIPPPVVLSIMLREVSNY